jgi:hypothetical protein
MPKDFAESLEDLFDDFCALFYSPPKNKKVKKRKEKLTTLKPKEEGKVNFDKEAHTVYMNNRKT